MKVKSLVMLLLAMSLVLSGCCKQKKTVRVEPTPLIQPPPPSPQPCAKPKMVSDVQGYPVRGQTGKDINVEKLAPSQIVVNEPFNYRLKVTNLTNQELLNVVVTDVKPDHMRFLSSEPKMEIVGGEIRWALGRIEPKGSKTVAVRATATRKQEIVTCADVTYDIPTCAKIQVVEPKLRLTKHAPKVSLRCDRIPIRYEVTNTGSGTACDINIRDKFSEGMVTAKGKEDVSFNVAALGPGETKEFRVTVDATRPGEFASKAIANARTGGKATSQIVKTLATEPVLAIEYQGPGRQYLGRSVTYDIKITNNGDAIAKDTILEVMLPENVTFTSATTGGIFTHSSPGKVTWNFGTVNPKESRTSRLTITSHEPGKITTRATAKAYCAKTVADSVQTVYSGISAILLEVVDVSDPVEIGQATTYAITVTNQGSASDKDIRVKCVLEEGMQYLSSGGPTKASVVGSEITFAPLATLTSKAQATWLVNVRAISTGDKRFKATMITEQLERPVEETEATKFYEEL